MIELLSSLVIEKSEIKGQPRAEFTFSLWLNSFPRPCIEQHVLVEQQVLSFNLPIVSMRFGYVCTSWMYGSVLI